MSDTPWTPGPWTWGPARDLREDESPTAIGMRVDGDGYVIADVTRQPPYEQELANARLIAAAPEMAELLDEMRVLLEMEGESYTTERARALLSRIRGEA